MRAAKNSFLTVRCNSEKGDWNSVLSVKTDQGGSVVARFEFHADHPGLHAHAECNRGGIEVGPTGLDSLIRFPNTGSFHRRATVLTDGGFLEACKRFFRIEERKGPLL